MHLSSALRLVRATGLLGALAVAAVPALADGTSTQQNQTVTFATPGLKTVTLTACSQVYPLMLPACSVKTVTIAVLDPTPSLLGATATPGELPIPNSVHLSATAAGQPPLTFTWHVADANQVPVATLTGAEADWSTAAVTAGAYTVELDVSNAEGPTASSGLLPIVVDPDPRIFWSSFEGVPPDAGPWLTLPDPPP